jgi:hypothetical protein
MPSRVTETTDHDHLSSPPLRPPRARATTRTPGETAAQPPAECPNPQGSAKVSKQAIWKIRRSVTMQRTGGIAPRQEGECDELRPRDLSLGGGTPDAAAIVGFTVEGYLDTGLSV